MKFDYNLTFCFIFLWTAHISIPALKRMKLPVSRTVGGTDNNFYPHFNSTHTFSYCQVSQIKGCVYVGVHSWGKGGIIPLVLLWDFLGVESRWGSEYRYSTQWGKRHCSSCQTCCPLPACTHTTSTSAGVSAEYCSSTIIRELKAMLQISVCSL